jgi:drug/metabolite transporter (DMT)-like permease
MRKQKDSNPADSFTLAHLLTFLAALPFCFSGGMPSAKSWAGIFSLGIFQIGIPSLLYASGIARVTAISAVFITMLEPLMNPVWVFVFAGEKPSVNAVAGGAVILAFISFRSFVNYRRSRGKAPSAS